VAKAVADAGFHAGELAVQQQAGVRDEAARLVRMLEPAQLRGGMAAFLAGRTSAVITGRDASGRLWTSPLAGPPGFLEVVSPAVLAVRASLPEADPLYGLPPGQPVGLVVVEFATRRRVRVNGVLAAASDGTLTVEAEQAYGNCPQYIRQRVVGPDTIGRPGGDVRRGAALSARDAQLAGTADTFFLGTTHPGRGSDASHRGGPPGFVAVRADGRLCWPDYPGNNLFNSLGNLAVEPAAALLFADFGTGRTLQLSGTAEVEWNAAAPTEDASTGRRVCFSPERLVARG
jgi:uncharacterized protein